MDKIIEPSLDQYLLPKFNLDNIDRFYVRKSILDFVNKNKGKIKGVLLDVGCGVMPYRSLLMQPHGLVHEYLGLDFESSISEAYAKIKPHLTWDGSLIPMDSGSVDAVLLTEVMEHSFEPNELLEECNRVLKTQGIIIITVPFLWPLHDTPYDAYRYTPFSLEKMLQKAGFSEISIEALGGWHASFGQMIGLWLNRSGIQGWKRKVLYFVFRPFVKWLFAIDRRPKNFTEDSYMLTGLSVIAYKNKV